MNCTKNCSIAYDPNLHIHFYKMYPVKIKLEDMKTMLIAINYNILNQSRIET